MRNLELNPLGKVDKLLSYGFTTNNKIYSELSLLARYCSKNMEYSRKETTILMNDFCGKWDETYNYVIDMSKIERAISYAYGKKAKPLCGSVSVEITVGELESISKIKDFKKQKLLFSMLVISKIKSNGCDFYALSRKYDSDVIFFSKANTSIGKYDFIIREFGSLGLIETIKPGWRDNNFIKLLYPELTGTRAFFIDVVEDDFIKHYINYYGGEQIYCKTCGKMTTKKSNRQILCPSCWEEKRRKDIRNNVKNFRKRNVIVSDPIVKDEKRNSK